MELRKRLLEILKEKAVFRFKEAIKLASGGTSNYYIDCRQVTLDPEGCYLVGELFWELADSLGATAVVGLTLGADPLVVSTGLAAYRRKKPLKMAIVRKEAKTHGLQRRIEGPPLSETERVLVVEDVATTGASALMAVDALEAEFKCKIIAISAIVNREEGAKEAIEKRGIPFIPFFTKEELL
ncbi:MAG: orotate phosphoribosyltransferase [Planctomycetota bacterium]|nr:orotate phosphoribosyltransferase [Planctomycetota bacterium]